MSGKADLAASVAARLLNRARETGDDFRAIVACEGEHGWDDYLLLHHWDRRLKLDAARKATAGRRTKRRASRAGL